MKINMIDVSAKESIPRTATAEGRIVLKSNTLEKIKNNQIKKGDPLIVAEIAAINAVKETPRIIPLCHQIPISGIETNFEINDDSITARVTVKAVAKTGAEMEAIVGVNTALTTIWDMVKYLEKNENGQYPHTLIEKVRVVKKTKNEP
ncbi:MAG: cyclic pyranopterin monophosphate synthase MoaC [Candidatus Altiarchaeota archaeon]|nr:cyclic pyranopterin monophosphate synthase MoaC [Candidatus Altiarchaeota archaeon]MBU4341016.1 cyclic pyranopterin monophosphate synthase MoaC [Candidatus Altiarchaeota archaeon]MBU4437804.1 cyclic pyranopterin monophosphate synthase MoaC [Candidatus Altiarchaeota archaeon]